MLIKFNYLQYISLEGLIVKCNHYLQMVINIVRSYIGIYTYPLSKFQNLQSISRVFMSINSLKCYSKFCTYMCRYVLISNASISTL